jgi:hypothetical protein
MDKSVPPYMPPVGRWWGERRRDDLVPAAAAAAAGGRAVSSYDGGPWGKERLEVEFLLALHFIWLAWARQARHWAVLGRKGGRWLW